MPDLESSNGFNENEITSILEVVGYRDEKITIAAIKEFCNSIEHQLIGEVVAESSQVETLHLTPQLLDDFGESSVLQSDKWGVLGENKGTLRRMADKLNSLSEELSQYK